VVPFVVFTGLYVFLAIIVFFLLRRQFLESPELVSEPSPTSTHA